MNKEFPYGVVEPYSIPDTADKVLVDYFRVVKELGIPSCFAYGLCLGIVRDGGYIQGDNDLDVVVIAPTNGLTPVLLEGLTGCGFSRGAHYGHPCNNVHFHRDKILLDISFKESGIFYKQFDYVMYKGTLYSVPNPVDEYLTKCYGDWKVKGTISTRYR